MLRFIPMLLVAAPAAADLTVTFRDGAPKDRFVITADGACPVAGGTLSIDIGAAPSGLIFDTTGTGAGVEVFQPFELTAGADLLSALPVIADGDTQIDLPITNLAPGDRVSFTIDVDDTTSARQITVDGSEMAGALIRFDGRSATFDATGTARLALPDCLS
ncbi:MAG: aggregation factor core [Pseudomonadota bacterium]